MTPVPFRFDAGPHEYVDLETGVVLPHITGMLKDVGLIDDRWFTEESSLRGQRVHALTSDYDLGNIDDPAAVDDSTEKGWLLAYVKATSILRAQGLAILSVEEPIVHPAYRFGGRPDRVVRLGGRLGVLEIKSGAVEKSHQIQTALQCELVAADGTIPAWALARWCLYIKERGTFSLDEHVDRRNFDEGRRIIRRTCGR